MSNEIDLVLLLGIPVFGWTAYIVNLFKIAWKSNKKAWKR